MSEEGQSVEVEQSEVVRPERRAGLIEFYGLFWDRKFINWRERIAGGLPEGWVGRGNGPDDGVQRHQVNFWKQQGIYILYDANMNPMYAGRSGRGKAGTNSIGDRISSHYNNQFRNAWTFFSWFGLLGLEKMNLRESSREARLDPQWHFGTEISTNADELLATLEAVLIEGVAPRMNARGGDLLGAVWVKQAELP